MKGLIKSRVGEEFITDLGTVMKVIMKTDKKKDNKCIYILECSICSLDEELWPLGSITDNNLKSLNTRKVCGCGDRVLWTEAQYKILLTREAQRTGFIFLGFATKFEGYATKVSFRGKNHEEIIETTSIGLFLKGVRGKYFGVIKAGNSHKKDYCSYIDRFYATGKFIKGTIFGSSIDGTANRDWSYRCPLCSSDEFVVGGLCSGVFKGRTSDLLLGRRVCRCGKSWLTQEQQKFKINNTLKPFRGCFNRWVGGVYVNVNSVFTWKCQHNHENKKSVKNFFKKVQGCKVCSDRKGGFDPNKTATFYLYEWYGFAESYLKYGITNRSVNERISEQSREASLDFREINTHYFQNGQDALNIENLIKCRFGRKGVCPREWLPQGFTETVYSTKENLEIINNIVGNYSLIDEDKE